MFEGQKPPSKAAHLQWTRLQLEMGKSVQGWKVGPAYGFNTHFAPYSKPCKHLITSGNLECNYCTAKLRKGFTGYLPMIDECGEKIVVLYGRDWEERVQAIPYGAAIKVSKGKFKAAKIVIRLQPNNVVPCPWLGKLQVQHDIRPWLLQLWGDVDLISYFGQTPQEIPLPENDNALSQSKRETSESMEAAIAKMRERMNLIGIHDEEPNKPAKPALNGKHRK